jgi:hypothetical protein
MMKSLAFAAVFLFLAATEAAQASPIDTERTCGPQITLPVAQEESSKFKADVDLKLKSLGRVIGGDFAGKAAIERRTINQSTSSIAPSVGTAYFDHEICRVVMSAEDLNAEQKLQALNKYKAGGCANTGIQIENSDNVTTDSNSILGFDCGIVDRNGKNSTHRNNDIR